MSKTFKLKVLTPAATVLDEDVEQIVTKAIDGEIGILPDHIPLITPLSIAPLQYWKNGEKRYAAVLGGMMEVSKDSVTIISDHAALAENIDVVLAEKEREAAQAKMSQKTEKLDVQKAEMELSRLLMLLQVAELAKRMKK